MNLYIFVLRADRTQHVMHPAITLQQAVVDLFAGDEFIKSDWIITKIKGEIV